MLPIATDILIVERILAAAADGPFAMEIYMSCPQVGHKGRPYEGDCGAGVDDAGIYRLHSE